MERLKIAPTIFTILITALFLFTAIGSSKLVVDKPNVLHETVTSNFTLSGTTAGGHPLLSWNSVSGAEYYKL